MKDAQMRVLVFTSIYPRRSSRGGTFVEEQVEDLPRLNVDVGVLHFDPWTIVANTVERSAAFAQC